MKILSLDVETDGLWGNPFAIGAMLFNDGELENVFFSTLPKSIITNEWVKENVLSTLPDTHTHESLNDMLRDFAYWYQINKIDARVLWHMGHVVESNLFRMLVDRHYIGEWDAPYCPIEMSTMLESCGLVPDSVDNYVQNFNVEMSEAYSKMDTHNPLFDAYSTYICFKDVVKKYNIKIK